MGSSLFGLLKSLLFGGWSWFLLLEKIAGDLIVEVLGLIDDHIGGREAFGVDGVVRLEAQEQSLVHGYDFRRNLKNEFKIMPNESKQ